MTSEAPRWALRDSGCAATPGLTGGSIVLMTSPYDGDFTDVLTFAARGIGWASLPFSLAIDVMKAPIGLAGAGILGAVGGLQRLFGAASGRVNEFALNAILDSVLERMPATLAIFCGAGVETPESLRLALNNGGRGRLLALTLLHTAFVSRDLADGALLMASGRTFSAAACPRAGRGLLARVTEAQRLFRARAACIRRRSSGPTFHRAVAACISLCPW